MRVEPRRYSRRSRAAATAAATAVFTSPAPRTASAARAAMSSSHSTWGDGPSISAWPTAKPGSRRASTGAVATGARGLVSTEDSATISSWSCSAVCPKQSTVVPQ